MQSMRQRWDERYADDEFMFGTEPNDFLREQFRAIPPGRVLCLADGEGRNGVFLAQQGYDVTSVDLSPVGLAKARRLAEAKGVTIDTVAADLDQYALGSDRWSGIVWMYLHPFIDLRTKLFRAATKALTPGGVFLLEAYTPEQLARGTGGPSDASQMPTLAEIEAGLAGLTFEIGREIERDVIEGAGHFGLASVVQVVARRPAVDPDR